MYVFSPGYLDLLSFFSFKINIFISQVLLLISKSSLDKLLTKKGKKEPEIGSGKPDTEKDLGQSLWLFAALFRQFNTLNLYGLA